MATEILLSTVSGDVTINDFGGRTFTHPTSDIDLLLEFSEEEIRDSGDLASALSGNTVTLIDDLGVTIDNLEDLREEAIKNNFSASVDPTADDDDTAGYHIGSEWVNETDTSAFICLDNATGVAIWQTINNLGLSNFAYCVDESNQALTTINIYQDLLIDTNIFLDGWTHTLDTGVFTCNQTGGYRGTVEVTVEKAGSGSPQAAIRTLFNGVEILGSHFGMDITSNNTAFALTRSFFFAGVSGQDLIPQWTASNNTVFVTTAPNPGGSTAISVTVSILRVS